MAKVNTVQSEFFVETAQDPTVPDPMVLPDPVYPPASDTRAVAAEPIPQEFFDAPPGGG